ncbi:hypothetical protein CFK41_07745 [Brachybacterium ginsengisoli]|uniref:SHOCT domain-containing protein n=1 Tax=Brachybacterium ginsengisoli TaxID=1331682 RepID=A0A291GWS2_9MICO|nr:SHOCT domain-containing protein [Brachybacterium ginsengisoli]ATG54671.1 hypothetical protein CFK41_07745 [Brachybacterium ginsengisoli]
MLTETTTQLIVHGPYEDGALHGGFFPVFPFLFLLVLVALFVLAGMRRRRWHAAAPRREAETALGERFARGEIDEDEYRTRRAVLREKG